ncbi:MAG: DUF126 domain-containing protein [Candidatus Dadabacteria bacterium]|nr:MAG: DUF126 domain-containing protein [Candidatus Dadabacteria bacterium]
MSSALPAGRSHGAVVAASETCADLFRQTALLPAGGRLRHARRPARAGRGRVSAQHAWQGRPILRGRGSGPFLGTDVPVNFTAAFTKIPNLLPWRRAEVRDRHHPWYRRNIRGHVIALPTCIGSTHTGLVLLDLVRMHNGPAAIIVDHADSLLVSGVVLSEVWYDETVPIVEYDTAELRSAIPEGTTVAVDGETGSIEIVE